MGLLQAHWKPGVLMMPTLPSFAPTSLVISKTSRIFSDDKIAIMTPIGIQYLIQEWYVIHDDVTKWKHIPRYWPFVRGIHRSPVNSPHKGQWRGALIFSLNCAWINAWVNNHEVGDSRHHCAHYDVMVMFGFPCPCYLANYLKAFDILLIDDALEELDPSLPATKYHLCAR